MKINDCCGTHMKNKDFNFCPICGSKLAYARVTNSLYKIEEEVVHEALYDLGVNSIPVSGVAKRIIEESEHWDDDCNFEDYSEYFFEYTT